MNARHSDDSVCDPHLFTGPAAYATLLKSLTSSGGSAAASLARWQREKVCHDLRPPRPCASSELQSQRVFSTCQEDGGGKTSLCVVPFRARCRLQDGESSEGGSEDDEDDGSGSDFASGDEDGAEDGAEGSDGEDGEDMDDGDDDDEEEDEDAPVARKGKGKDAASPAAAAKAAGKGKAAAKDAAASAGLTRADKRRLAKEAAEKAAAQEAAEAEAEATGAVRNSFVEHLEQELTADEACVPTLLSLSFAPHAALPAYDQHVLSAAPDRIARFNLILIAPLLPSVLEHTQVEKLKVQQSGAARTVWTDVGPLAGVKDCRWEAAGGVREAREAAPKAGPADYNLPAKLVARWEEAREMLQIVPRAVPCRSPPSGSPVRPAEALVRRSFVANCSPPIEEIGMMSGETSNCRYDGPPWLTLPPAGPSNGPPSASAGGDERPGGPAPRGRPQGVRLAAPGVALRPAECLPRRAVHLAGASAGS